MLQILKNNQRPFYCASIQPSDALSFLWISSISTRPVLIIAGKKGLSYIYDCDDDFIVLQFIFFFLHFHAYCRYCSTFYGVYFTVIYC